MSFQERAADAIRSSGGRMTRQRSILLDLLAHGSDDIDAEQLHQHAIQHDPRISLPTVYRTLHTLEAAHLVAPRFSSSDHERKVYRLVNSPDAVHFTCRKCGRVISYESDLISQLKRDLADQLGADLATFCMCAGGLCADCRKE